VRLKKAKETLHFKKSKAQDKTKKRKERKDEEKTRQDKRTRESRDICFPLTTHRLG
jgi:hypothetical protein